MATSLRPSSVALVLLLALFTPALAQDPGTATVNVGKWVTFRLPKGWRTADYNWQWREGGGPVLLTVTSLGTAPSGGALQCLEEFRGELKGQQRMDYLDNSLSRTLWHVEQLRERPEMKETLARLEAIILPLYEEVRPRTGPPKADWLTRADQLATELRQLEKPEEETIRDLLTAKGTAIGFRVVPESLSIRASSAGNRPAYEATYKDREGGSFRMIVLNETTQYIGFEFLDDDKALSQAPALMASVKVSDQFPGAGRARRGPKGMSGQLYEAFAQRYGWSTLLALMALFTSLPAFLAAGPAYDRAQQARQKGGSPERCVFKWVFATVFLTVTISYGLVAFWFYLSSDPSAGGLARAISLLVPLLAMMIAASTGTACGLVGGGLAALGSRHSRARAQVLALGAVLGLLAVRLLGF